MTKRKEVEETAIEAARAESRIDIVRDAKGWNKSFSKKFNETMDLAANDAMVGFTKTMSAAAHYAKALKMAQKQGKSRQAVVEEFRYRVRGKLDKDQIYHILNWEKRVEGSRQRRLAEKAKVEEIHRRWQEQEIKEKERLELESKVRIDTKVKEHEQQQGPVKISEVVEAYSKEKEQEQEQQDKEQDQDKAKLEELKKRIQIIETQEVKKGPEDNPVLNAVKTENKIALRMIHQLGEDKRRLFDTIAEKDKIITQQKKEVAKLKEQPDPEPKPRTLTVTEQDNIDLKNKLAELTEKTEKTFRTFNRLMYLLTEKKDATNEEIGAELRERARIEHLVEMKKTREDAKNAIITEVRHFSEFDMDNYRTPLLREFVRKLKADLKANERETTDNIILGQFVTMIVEMFHKDKKLLDIVVDKIDKEVKMQERYRNRVKFDDKTTALQWIASNVLLNKNVGPMLNKMIGTGSGEKLSDRNAILSNLDSTYRTAVYNEDERKKKHAEYKAREDAYNAKREAERKAKQDARAEQKAKEKTEGGD